MPASRIRLVAVDGVQVAPVPKRRVRAKAIRQEREVTLCIIKEHLGHLTHSLDRLKTLTNELEVSLGISIPDFTSWPVQDARSAPPEVSA